MAIAFSLLILGVGVLATVNGTDGGVFWIVLGTIATLSAIWRRVRPLSAEEAARRATASATEGGGHPYLGNFLFAVAAGVLVAIVKPDDELSSVENAVLATIGITLALDAYTFYDRRKASA